MYCFLALFSFVVTAQEKRVTIDDFVKEHQGLEENEQGEIVPINDREINKRFAFLLKKSITQNIPEISFGTAMKPLSVLMIVTTTTPLLYR